jgi:hypothetical protein
MESSSGGDGVGADVGFAYIWKAFSDASIGFKSANIRFRNIGHFNEILRSLINTHANSALSAFDNLILAERQRSDRREFAHEVTARAGGTCTFNILGVANVDNFARTNDYFNYYYDGNPARASISLRYSPVLTGTPSDLDLYAWLEEFDFDDSSTMMAASERMYPESGITGLETISLAGLKAGYYLIHVRADPANTGTTSQYYLETNGGSERLCP